jgi:hypothetical protein
MRLSIWLFFSVLLIHTCIAQRDKNITGTVLDTLQNPISFANVVAYHLQKDTVMLSFAQTDEKGAFSLSVPDSLNEVYLRVSLLGYQDTWKKIILTKNNYLVSEPIVLHSTAVQIQDILVVDKRTFNASGDTLTINVNTFRDSTEKNIEDLLKKIPGFDVDQEGKIYFKGKQIQRIAIEGEDIVKQNYQIISRNFSARAIEDIQVISNFSENPLLANAHGQDKETVLNLRLDEKHKNTWSKQIDVYTSYPFLYDVYANIGMISKNLKTINFVNANTLSRNKIADFSHRPQRTILPDLFNANHTWITLYQTPFSSIEPFLYQNHQGYSINTATSYKFSPRTTLKFTGYGNIQEQHFTEKQDMQNAGIFITGDKKTAQLKKIPFSDIELAHFLPKKYFLTYTASYKQIQNNESQSQNMNIFQNHTELKSKNIFHSQHISYTQNIKKKYIFRHQVKYLYSDQTLNYVLYQYPAQKFPLTNYFADTISQNIGLPQNNIIVQSDVFARKMRYSVAYMYLFQGIQSHIKTQPNIIQDSTFTNNNNNTLQMACFSTYKEITWGKFFVHTELKPYFLLWNYSHKESLYQKKSLYTILPDIRIVYKPFSLNYSYQIQPMDIQKLYTGYTFTGSGSLSRGTALLYPAHIHTGVFSHYYDRYTKGIMMNNLILYTVQKGVMATYTQIDSIYTLSQLYPEAVQQTVISWQSIFSKVFFKYRWAINFFLSAFQSENQNFLYGIPIHTQQRLLMAHFKAYLLPRKVFYFGLGSKMQYTSTQNKITDTPLLFAQRIYQIEPYFYTHLRYKKWTFSTKGLYFLNYNNYFSVPFALPWMHIEGAYAAVKKNYNISLKCENIFNHKQWLTNSVTMFTNQQSFIPMRGRMYILNFTYTL